MATPKFPLVFFFLYALSVHSREVMLLKKERVTQRAAILKTFQLSSLFSSSTCNHSTKADESKSTLKVVDKYGPCFQPNQGKINLPSLTNILCLDRPRINSIWYSRIYLNSGSNHRRDMIEMVDSTCIPAKDDRPFDTLSFVVTVGFGTPKKDLSLVFDTASKDLSLVFDTGSDLK
ncbi:hypothetical protein ACOSP7_007999 [Xanthoceras sorbifolium]